MKRPRDRSSSQSEHVTFEAEPLESFLVFDTESVLLVNHDQSQLRERNVGAKNAMGADYNVGLSGFEIREHGCLLFGSLKATECLNVHRKIREAFAERSRVLVGKNRRRNEDDYLTAGLHCLECSAYRDFGFAVTDVTDQQAIHRPRTLHVALHICSRGPLVGGILE